MKYFVSTLFLVLFFNMNAQSKKNNDDMLVRISEVEVYPQFLQEYLTFALNVGATSMSQEPGVIAIYPMIQQRDSCQIRILEIYADHAAYRHHIATEHFQAYKKKTLHMVKSLDLVDMEAINESDMPNIFKKMVQPVSSPQSSMFKMKDRASNEYNTGEVYVDLLKESEETMITSFLFMPNSRNFWHYHPDAEQSLIVLNGEGFYQEEGKPKRLIRKGDVIVTAPNVRHWNGATDARSIECMTVTEHSFDNHAVPLRAVTDDEYIK